MRKTRRAVLMAGASALVARPALAQGTAPATPREFDLQGHRGARWLYPENTLPGFAYALGVGVTTLELDIAITKDRVLADPTQLLPIHAPPLVDRCRPYWVIAVAPGNVGGDHVSRTWLGPRTVAVSAGADGLLTRANCCAAASAMKLAIADEPLRVR